MSKIIEPQVGDIIDVLNNRAEVMEVFKSHDGTKFVRAEDVEGNLFTFPIRMVDVIFCAIDEALVPAEDVEIEAVAGLWYDGESDVDASEPRNIWAQEVA